jgi:hypothetical protein
VPLQPRQAERKQLGKFEAIKQCPATGQDGGCATHAEQQEW